MRRKLNLTLLALIVLIGAPYYWLMLDNRPGQAQPKPVTITQLRELAQSMPGPAPSAAEVELVAYRELPGNLFAAGSGMRNALIGIMAWRLPVPDGPAVMIDGGITARDAREIEVDRFFRDRQDLVRAALRNAGIVLATHEHVDHQGGIVQAGGDVVRKRAWFNPGQLPPSPYATQLRWGSQPVPTPRIRPGPPQAVAPGVVVVPAPSHTPGSQMVFVRLGNGREFLFTGDIATLQTSWQDLRARARLVGDIIAPENRAEVHAWLKTIKALKAQAPGLVVIPGHDWRTIVSDPEIVSSIRIGFGQQPTG